MTKDEKLEKILILINWSNDRDMTYHAPAVGMGDLPVKEISDPGVAEAIKEHAGRQCYIGFMPDASSLEVFKEHTEFYRMLSIENEKERFDDVEWRPFLRVGDEPYLVAIAPPSSLAEALNFSDLLFQAFRVANVLDAEDAAEAEDNVTEDGSEDTNKQGDNDHEQILDAKVL